MNKNDIEVELKYIVKPGKKKGLYNWLKLNAKLIFKNHQIDKYFTPAHRNFFSEKYPKEYLRIRSSNNRYSITYKYRNTTGKENAYSHYNEYETNVESDDQLLKIFKALNFRHLITVDKTRSSFEYENFEIEIDDVKKLGLICEIEIKDDYTSVKEAHIQIHKLAKKLGFSENDRGDDLKLGYVYVIAKNKGLIS